MCVYFIIDVSYLCSREQRSSLCVLLENKSSLCVLFFFSRDV